MGARLLPPTVVLDSLREPRRLRLCGVDFRLETHPVDWAASESGDISVDDEAWTPHLHFVRCEGCIRGRLGLANKCLVSRTDRVREVMKKHK